MTTSRIFIASSDMAKLIAGKLRNELYTEYCSAKLWDEIMKKKPGQSKIETLEQLKEEYDFVIILLTKDDVLAKDLGAKLKVRDDCVFEAGFFMSAIGRGRCFLVSGVGRRDPPTECQGVLPFTF